VRVYVAGPSHAWRKIRQSMARLRDVGHVVTYDWTVEVEASRVMGEVDQDYSDEERGTYAAMDLSAVADAEVVWVQCSDFPTRGAWAEMGFAIARKVYDPSPVALVVSGDWPQTIFTEFADERFATHDEALAWISKLPAGDVRLREGG
jgi:hypothetical protein